MNTLFVNEKYDLIRDVVPPEEQMEYTHTLGWIS